MRLSDSNIIAALADPGSGLRIVPEPTLGQITGITVDVHLGDAFTSWLNDKRFVVDPTARTVTTPSFTGSGKTHDLGRFLAECGKKHTGFIDLQPGMFCLGVTKERITIPKHLVGWLDGRSTLARHGVLVHVTAHRIDPGWDGNVVLEFYNCGPYTVRLTGGMRVGALSFETICGEVQTPYVARTDATYQNQTGVVLPGGKL